MTRRRSSQYLSMFLITSAIGCLHSAPEVSADSWGPPTPEHWSSNHRFVLRVGWPDRVLKLEEKREHDYVLRWSATYPQEDAPVEAYITDDGQYVVLRDVWGRVGYGMVLAFLGPTGKLLNAFTLNDLLTEAEILYAPLSISSRWWSSNALFFFQHQQTQFAFVTHEGTLRVFELATGRRVAPTPAVELETRSEAIRLARRDLAEADPRRRAAGARQIGVLGDRESIERLKQLLNDQTVTSRVVQGTGRDEVSWDEHDVQAAAGEALVALLGPGAVPLLEAKLSAPEPAGKAQWLALLAQSGAVGSSSVVKRLAGSPNRDIRRAAIRALLDGDDGTVIHQNINWLTDHDPEVRYQAVRALAEHSRGDDAGLLRNALQDKNSADPLWALRGLVRLQPPDLDVLLGQIADKHPGADWMKDSVAEEAVLELARRGDAAALRRLIEWLGSLPDRVRRNEPLSGLLTGAVCRVLAARKERSSVPALWAARDIPYGRTQCAIWAALAALGDWQATDRVREFARHGGALERASAIKWLGILKDRDSLGFLRQQLEDPEPWVRDAAREALKQIDPDEVGSAGKSSIEASPLR
jgi:HEAT repeat protein